MSPLLPEEPLSTIGAGQWATTAELQSCSRSKSKHLIAGPIHKFPAYAIVVKILNSWTRSTYNDFLPSSPGNSRDVFQILSMFPSLDQVNCSLLPLPTDNYIYLEMLFKRNLVGIRRI